MEDLASPSAMGTEQYALAGKTAESRVRSPRTACWKRT